METHNIFFNIAFEIQIIHVMSIPKYQDSWPDELLVAPLWFLLQLVSSAQEIFRMQTQDAAASGAMMGWCDGCRSKVRLKRGAVWKEQHLGACFLFRVPWCSMIQEVCQESLDWCEQILQENTDFGHAILGASASSVQEKAHDLAQD